MGQVKTKLRPDTNSFVMLLTDGKQYGCSAAGGSYEPDTNTITFYGSYCDKLKNDEVWDVDVVFGCDGPVPE